MNARAKRVSALVALALCISPSVCPGTPGDGEDELKSATVLSFLRYATWPGNPRPNEVLTVGVLGRPSFAKTLGGLLEGKSVNGRAVRLVELKAGADVRCCQLIYFATGKKTEIQQVLQNAGSAHTLTIGEDDKFLEYGGAVNLELVDGHMGFEVNLEVLGLSGVDISAKLLRLGRLRGRRGV